MRSNFLTAILMIAAVAGCGCQATSSGVKSPDPAISGAIDLADKNAEQLKADSADLNKQLDVASVAVDAACADLADFIKTLPEPTPKADEPVVEAAKELQNTAVPALVAAKVDAKKIEDVTSQISDLAAALGKIRKDVKSLSTDRDNGWREATTQKTRADDGMRRDFMIVGIFGVLALGLGVYLCATGNFKIGALAIGGGVAVIIGAAVGVWLLDHWWQVALGLSAVGAAVVLLALAWNGYLGAKAKAALRDAVANGEAAHEDNAGMISTLTEKFTALEQKLGLAAPPATTPPATADTPPTA